MLGTDRRAARSTFTAALVLLMLYLVYLVRSTLFVFTLALFFSYMLSPLVNLLNRLLPANRRKGTALALAYVIVVGVVAVAGIELGSRVVDEANALVVNVPDMLRSLQESTAQASGDPNSIQAQIMGKIHGAITERSGDLLSLVPQAGMKFLSAASHLIFVIVIPILAFFILKDSDLIRDHLLDMAPNGQRRELLKELMADFHLLLVSYMRALAGLSLVAFAAYSVFFSIIGVPYAVLMAAIGGLFEFIPMVGPLVASAVIITVAGVSGSHMVAVLIFLAIYRIIQDYVISPQLMGKGVELHPLLTLFGVFAGAEIAGVPGTFLSIPVLAMARIFYIRIRKTRRDVQLRQQSDTAH